MSLFELSVRDSVLFGSVVAAYSLPGVFGCEKRSLGVLFRFELVVVGHVLFWAARLLSDEDVV